jgi:hypothetical protein
VVSERRLVLDANILVRAVLGRRVRQIIETTSRCVCAGQPRNANNDHGQPLSVLRFPGSY